MSEDFTLIPTALRQVYIGRQPILDGKLEVYGYELLFRGNVEATGARIGEADSATSRVLLNAFVDIGLENLCGGKYAFFNLTRDFIVNNVEFPFPGDKVAIEFLEDEAIDDDLIIAAKAWADRGYLLALDDFTWRDDAIPLLGFAHIVKLDVMALGEKGMQEHVDKLRQFQQLKILAEKIETPDEFAFYQRMGCDYFQGYFFSKPDTVKAESLADNKLSVLRLLQKLAEPDVGPRELEAIIRTDVGMTYKLLKCVNSAFYGANVKLESINRAIIYMGVDAVRNWVRMLALAGLDDRPSELARHALVRARLAEEVAHEVRGHLNAEAAFTAGLFSMLDALLNVPLHEALKELPLSENVREALVEGRGPLGDLLKQVIAFEQGDAAILADSKLDSGEWNQLWLNAIKWADGALNVGRA